MTNQAFAGVIFNLSGTIFEADQNSTVSIGDPVSGYVVLTDAAAAYSSLQEFSLGNGDVLDIAIHFGNYDWDLARPSVHWVQFEGYMSPDGSGFSNISVRLLENFLGIVDPAFCPSNQVCSIGGGINNVQLYDGYGFSTGTTIWSRAREAPEPLTLSLFGTGLVGAVAMRRRKIKLIR